MNNNGRAMIDQGLSMVLNQGNKQFLNEVDMISKTEFNNCFIIHILEAFSYFELL